MAVARSPAGVRRPAAQGRVGAARPGRHWDPSSSTCPSAAPRRRGEPCPCPLIRCGGGADRPAHPLRPLRRHRQPRGAGPPRRRPAASTCSRSPTTTRTEGWQEAADGRRAGRGRARARDRDQLPGTRAAACTCSPTCPTRRTPAGRRARPGARRPSASAARDRHAAARASGIDIEVDDVRRVAGRPPLGRPHVADALVAKGVVARPRRGVRPVPRAPGARRTSTATPPTCRP